MGRCRWRLMRISKEDRCLISNYPLPVLTWWKFLSFCSIRELFLAKIYTDSNFLWDLCLKNPNFWYPLGVMVSSTAGCIHTWQWVAPLNIFGNQQAATLYHLSSQSRYLYIGLISTQKNDQSLQYHIHGIKVVKDWSARHWHCLISNLCIFS